MEKELRVKDLNTYFSNWPGFTYDDLYEFYAIEEPELAKSLFNTRVSKLKESNVIMVLRSGVYRLVKQSSDSKNAVDSFNGNFMVITADIIDSQKHKITPKILEGKMEELNESIKEMRSVLLPFSSSRGDEFQGVTLIGPEIFEMIRNIRYTFLPVKVRIGLGIGFIEEANLLYQKNSPSDSWDMSGRAFLNARHALDRLKDTKKSRVLLHSLHSEGNQTFNLVYRLIDTIVEEWSDKQWEAIQQYNQLQSYEAGAKAIGISKSSFYQRCISAKWDVIRESENELAHLLVRTFLYNSA